MSAAEDKNHQRLNPLHHLGGLPLKAYLQAQKCAAELGSAEAAVGMENAQVEAT